MINFRNFVKFSSYFIDWMSDHLLLVRDRKLTRYSSPMKVREEGEAR